MDTLNTNDINNLLKMLARTQYNGIEEAQVGLILTSKLQEMAKQIEAPEDKD